jgi:hypothetical protein
LPDRLFVQGLKSLMDRFPIKKKLKDKILHSNLSHEGNPSAVEGPVRTEWKNLNNKNYDPHPSEGTTVWDIIRLVLLFFTTWHNNAL